MSRSRNIKLLSLLMLITSMQHLYARNYFVDAKIGKDQANGLSAATAWRTIDQVNSIHFMPGDIIAFRAGQIFTGTLNINASGDSKKPIVYTSYGNGIAAVIDGKGEQTAIYCRNKEYIDLRNLSVTNHRNGKIGMEDLFTGILIINEDAGTLQHFHLDRVRVFNVNSTWIAKDEGKTDQSRFHGGVLFRTMGDKIRSNFDDVLVTNSVFENLSRTGFNFRSDWDDRSAYSRYGDSIGKGVKDNWTPNTRVVFRKNIFRHVAGNGLIVRVAIKALIEHNLFDSCGEVISGNAVFNFNTDSTIYQYNEARNTVYAEGETDARGIDSDYRTRYTIIQFNYLHDNEQGGLCAVGGPGVGEDPLNFNIGTIVRYNILENNLRQGMYFSGRVEKLEVYNNVFYAKKGIDNVDVVKLNKWTVYPNGSNFRNNIFYYEGANPKYEFTNATNVRFDRNIYYGVEPPQLFADAAAIRADPSLVKPGAGVNGYRVGKNSPAKRSGRVIAGTSTMDYYGNRIIVGGAINIGIDNSK
jgi:hypothetical protein